MKRKLTPINDWETFLKEARKEFFYVYYLPPEKGPSRNDYEFIKTIGTGAFGRVYFARNYSTGKYHAIKVLDKRKIVEHNQVEHCLNEKRVLLALNFPFCVYLEASFKDSSFLYMCLPFVGGGEMFTHLRKFGKFDEKLSRFYGAQILLAFEYIHHLEMVYRDLKPENIVIEPSGYIKLTDFGFCKILKGRTFTLCGTPEYLAPEIIANKGYGQAVDWWAYGVFLYEMVAGFTPFSARSPVTIYEDVLAGRYKTPLFFSEDLKNLTTHLIRVDLTRRYGNLVRGVDDIKYHPWFKEIDWTVLLNGKMKPPYTPNISGSNDASNFMPYTEINMVVTREDKFADQFKDF